MEVCGRRLDRAELESAFARVFRVKPDDVMEITLGDSWTVTIYSGDLELTVRCGVDAGGCEVMVRAGDEPSVYCGKSCSVDQAARNTGRAETLLPMVERLVDRKSVV